MHFRPSMGAIFGFFNFEALLDIFELGIQLIWIQHPSIKMSPKNMCHKLTRFASGVMIF